MCGKVTKFLLKCHWVPGVKDIPEKFLIGVLFIRRGPECEQDRVDDGHISLALSPFWAASFHMVNKDNC